jgi:hypothetical protein
MRMNGQVHVTMPRLPRTLRVPLWALMLTSVAPRPSAAQIGVATDILTGQVRSAEGVPIRGATVEAFSLETQVTRRALTDQNGRYTILFTDGGGQYRMTVRAIAYQPVREMIYRMSDEDRLIWSPALTPGAVTMEPITIAARQQPPAVRQPDRPTPGSTERALGPELVARLPLEDADLNLLATLMPGVVGIEGTDSSAAAFSVAGLGPEANALTLDGLLFGSGSIPQDGLRQTRVVTNTYDVSRGQFSGGLVAATTRAGSNVLQGSGQYVLRDDDLAVTGEDASPYAQGYTQHQLSGGIGGPIVRDRLFVFGSGQARLRSDPQQTILTATAQDYFRLGVHPDSVDRFLAIIDSLGVPQTAPVEGGRSSDNLSAMVRLDFLASNAHTVTARGDWRGTAADPSRLGPLAMPETGGTSSTGGGGGLLSLASRFGTRLLNDARVQLQYDRRDGDPYLYMPQGRVQVASELDDGSTGVTALVFGGNPGLPVRSRSQRLEGADELSLLAGRGHRVKLGGFAASQRQWDTPAANRFGTYTYNALGALETDRAASFRRTLAVAERETHRLDWALFAGDVWQASPRVQLTYGARLEGGAFAGAPPYNPDVDAVFGRRTDVLPSEWRLSPRAGFSWAVGGTSARGRLATTPTVIVRGGVGEFRSPVPAGLVTQAYSATGLDAAGREITCTGLQVPAPAWGAYAADTAAIPDACVGIGPVSSPPVSTVTLFAPDFQAARAWRGSLGIQRNLSPLFRVTLDGSYARGRSQAGYRDLNLDTIPEFGLAAEADRPVYVPVTDIAPGTGAVRFTGSRVDAAYGHVVEVHSDLASEAWQATAGVSGLLGRGIQLQLAYTWQSARDQGATARAPGGGARAGGGGGGAGWATTAGNPNTIEWARSDFERRHQLLLLFTYPFGTSLEVTSIGRLTSGVPYTPLVGSDINGDGVRNDRAYLFPAGSAEGDAIARMIAADSGSARACLASRVGGIAERNACTGPWQPALDFQVNWRPAFWGLSRRLTVSLVTLNFLRGVDELLHGADGAKGWGTQARPDGTLLYVTAFDPVTRRFAYQVNERFGATGGSATAFRPPFQIGLQARFTFGPDRRREALDAMRGGGMRGVGGMGGMGPGAGGGGTPAEMLARLESALPNPGTLVLAQRDSVDLGLSADQVAGLEQARDSLAARQAIRIERLRAILAERGPAGEPGRLIEAIRPVFADARADVLATHEAVRLLLSKEQWDRLPEDVRNLPGRMPGPGRQSR